MKLVILNFRKTNKKSYYILPVSSQHFLQTEHFSFFFILWNNQQKHNCVLLVISQSNKKNTQYMY